MKQELGVSKIFTRETDGPLLVYRSIRRDNMHFTRMQLAVLPGAAATS